MKRGTILLMVAAICQIANAQTVFDIGGYGEGNTTWLLNKNVNNDGDEQDIEFSGAIHFGFHSIVYFTDALGLETGVSFGKFSQKYIGGEGGQIILESSNDLSTFSIPFYVKLGKEAFFEFGIKYTNISKATHTNNVGLFDPGVKYTGLGTILGIGLPWVGTGPLEGSPPADVKGYYKNSFVSGVMGFGGNIEITDWVFLTMGMRFAWGFSDVKGVDGYGRNLQDPLLFTLDNAYKGGSPKSTTAAHAGFRLGVTFRIEG